MTLIIPKKLRGLIETYVAGEGRHKEKGGYLVGRENVITAFLPIPNQSEGSHLSSYWINRNDTYQIACELAKMVGGKVLGDLHTHPNGTIPSEQDGRHIGSLIWPYHVILSDKGKSFDWYCVDNSLKGIGLVDSDAQLEGIMELVAGELSLRDLGQFFLTPGGEVISSRHSSRQDGLKFITVDKDVLAFEDILAAKEDEPRRRSMIKICRESADWGTVPWPKIYNVVLRRPIDSDDIAVLHSRRYRALARIRALEALLKQYGYLALKTPEVLWASPRYLRKS